jgi:hypothetical protein
MLARKRSGEQHDHYPSSAARSHQPRQQPTLHWPLLLGHTPARSISTRWTPTGSAGGCRELWVRAALGP